MCNDSIPEDQLCYPPCCDLDHLIQQDRIVSFSPLDNAMGLGAQCAHQLEVRIGKIVSQGFDPDSGLRKTVE